MTLNLGETRVRRACGDRDRDGNPAVFAPRWGIRPGRDSAPGPVRGGCVVALVSLVLGVAAQGASPGWPRWRGATDQGSTEEGRYPAKLETAQAVWRTPLPGKGCSTPIVWRDRILLTAPVERRDAVLSFDLEGREVWRTTFGTEDPGKHRNGSGCNPSAVADGQGIYVSFKSGTLASVELSGKIRWQTNLVEAYGKTSLYWDFGTSPVLAGGSVIVARMHEGESWLAAFDPSTGALRWKAARNHKTPVEGDHGYSTPLVIQHQGREALLVWGGLHLSAHDPKDGAVLWDCGNFNPESKPNWPAVATPVVVGDIAVVPTGRADRTDPRLHGIRLGGSGDVTATHRVWKRDDVGAFVPTPAAAGGRVVVLRDRGEVESLEASTGKTVWKDQLPRASANYYASPLLASGRLVAAREDGKIFVAEAGDRFALLSENDLGERVVASPVAVGGRLLIRGERTLYCFAGE